MKGSTHTRIVEGKLNAKSVRKDLNWIEDKKKDPKMLTFSKINYNLMRDMRRDVHFLRQRGMLDYSLLIAIEQTQEEFNVEEILAKRRRYTAVSKNKSVISRSVVDTRGGSLVSTRAKRKSKRPREKTALSPLASPATVAESDEQGYLTLTGNKFTASEVMIARRNSSKEFNPITIVKP